MKDGFTTQEKLEVVEGLIVAFRPYRSQPDTDGVAVSRDVASAAAVDPAQLVVVHPDARGRQLDRLAESQRHLRRRCGDDGAGRRCRSSEDRVRRRGRR